MHTNAPAALFDVSSTRTTRTTVYERLAVLAGPIVTHYREDLTRHDRETIERHPGRPFLHFTRETGTHLYLIPTADDLPAPSERIPFLFGDVDRRDWLENFVGGVEAAATSELCRLCLWFDGRRFQRVEPARAVDIATEAAKRLRH